MNQEGPEPCVTFIHKQKLFGEQFPSGMTWECIYLCAYIHSNPSECVYPDAKVPIQVSSTLAKSTQVTNERFIHELKEIWKLKVLEYPYVEMEHW